MFATDWIFSLFGTIIPVECLGEFYDRFFVEGWSFFYQMVLSILKHSEARLLEQGEQFNILVPLKDEEEIRSNWKEMTGFFPFLPKKLQEKIPWERLIQTAQFDIDDNYIGHLLNNFDLDRKAFRITRTTHAQALPTSKSTSSTASTTPTTTETKR